MLRPGVRTDLHLRTRVYDREAGHRTGPCDGTKEGRGVIPSTILEPTSQVDLSRVGSVELDARSDDLHFNRPYPGTFAVGRSFITLSAHVHSSIFTRPRKRKVVGTLFVASLCVAIRVLAGVRGTPAAWVCCS